MRTTARHRSAAGGRARAGLALGALGALMLAAAADAGADGEQTPMLGGAVVGAWGPAPRDDLVGLELEAAWWRGRLGLALEGSVRWSAGGDGARAVVLGGSARVRVLERLLPSLLEPRDVELGLELHGIVERAWWAPAVPEERPTAYGLGLAIRLRGGGDEERSPLIAESRLFVRAVTSPRAGAEPILRAAAPREDEARELTIFVGVGAAFGAGDPGYLQRFRPRPFDGRRLEAPATAQGARVFGESASSSFSASSTSLVNSLM